MSNKPTAISTRILLLGLWSHFSRRRRIQTVVLLILMLASGCAELMSLGAILPFLTALTNPELLWGQPLVQDLAHRFGLTAASQLLLPATLAFVAAAVFAAVIRLANSWLNGRLAAAVGSDLSFKAYRNTLFQAYEVHVQRNSAAVVNSLMSHIDQTVVSLGALLQLLTSFVVAAGLLTGLLLIDAPVALAAAVLFGGSYGALAIASRREFRINGQKISEASTLQIKALQEGLGAIRDVLLDGTQSTYLQIYLKADVPKRQLAAKNGFVAVFPRFSLEALGMVSIALLGGFLVMQRGSGAASIPLLGAMALGAQRLLPALQQIYTGWASLNGYNVAIQSVLDMLNLTTPSVKAAVEPLTFRSGIDLDEIHFRYGSGQSEVLSGLNLKIRCGERIGFIGSTGSGKSTTMDILMGLLAPSTGRILVDGLDLHDPRYPERLAAWRACIAHVPQNIYLADSSIAENIAFGIPKHSIDLEQVKKAAEQAQIARFIESSHDGYASFVGERGVRLSGGQRQRIGIARALYKRASVIVLDEATSALDTNTENAVMQEIQGLSRKLTLLMIAHRLSTVQGCDRIIRLDQGVVVANGTPREVIDNLP